MSTFKLGAARVINEGTRDLSGRVVIQPTSVEPTHVPIIFLLTAKQHEEPIFMYPSQIEHLLGGETVERGSKYFSHQTQLLEVIAANANPFLCYPVQVEGSKKAFLRLSVAVTDLRPEAGAVEQFSETDVMKRYRLTWMSGVTAYPVEAQAFGEAEPFEIAPGTTVYPILEMQLEYAGDYGNSYGIQIKQIDSVKAPQGVAKSTAMPYSLSVIERTKSGAQRIVKTVFGEDTIAFTLDPEATDRLGRPLYLPLAFDNHFSITSGGTVQNFGEFENIHFYTAHVEEVQGLLYEEERQYDALIPTTLNKKWTLQNNPANASLLNIFTGKMFDGVTNYSSFTVEKALLIGSGNVIYAQGGDSGIPEEKTARARFNRANALLDSFVYDLKEEVVSQHSDLHSHDRWDFSVAYDTGFAPEAKDTLISLLSARKDVSLFLTPMSYGQLELVPEIEVINHEGYMRAVNNFQPIPYNRTGNIEVKGLITQLAADRALNNFQLYVDGRAVSHTDFRIDDKGYWTASIAATEFGVDGYLGYVQFTVDVGVIDRPEFPAQSVTSTKMEYQLTPASLPVPTVTQVWGGSDVPYSSAASEFQGEPGALVGTITCDDGVLTDLYDVLSAKFVYGNAKEYDITRNFVIWDQVYATPLRIDFLKNYEKSLTAKLVIRVRDKTSLEIKTIESQPYSYKVAFPVYNPLLTITEVNGGQPVIPSYANLNAPNVIVKGTVTGLGVDHLLSLDRMLIKVAGVTVSNANVEYLLNPNGESATFQATIQRGYFPILASSDQNINITAPAPGVVGESYHALADVDVIANYKQAHLNNAILPIADEQEVYVSDIISMSNSWDGIVDYNDPIPDLPDPNDGIILVSNLPTVAGIENVNVTLNGSFYDYQEIVSAKATLAGRTYDLKVLSNMTVGAARIIAEKFWPNYIKSGNIALELQVKHRSGHNVTMNVAQPYTVRYPTLPAVTTKVTAINGDDKIWFDENWNDANKTIVVSGEVTGLHTLRAQKNIQLSVDNIIREDVAVSVNKAAGTWSANLPVKYMNLTAGGQAQLNLTLTYLPENKDLVATATARAYTVKKVNVPNFVVETVNGGQAINWENGQLAEHKTEIVIGGYVNGLATPIDPAVFTMTDGLLSINDLLIPKAQVTWSRKVVGGVEKVLATVPTSYLIYQDRPFATNGIVAAKISLATNHNNRPYDITVPVYSYALTPKLGVVAVSVDSYNAGGEIDALNNPTATYTLRGEVTGMAPYQDVEAMSFTFQGSPVAPATMQLGVATMDEGGFITRPYTATFVGSSHLEGMVKADLLGLTDNQSSGSSLSAPTTLQDGYDFSSNLGAGWNTVSTGVINPDAYVGNIRATAVIGNSVTAESVPVASYASLAYTVAPQRAMVAKLGGFAPTFLDPGTDIVANQVRKLIDLEFAMVRTDYEEITAINIVVGGQTVNVSDVRYHRRDISSGLGEGKYQRHNVELSIPNKYIVDHGEYTEMTTPAYLGGETAVGLYKAGIAVTVTVRNKQNSTTRNYATVGTLFSRAYFGVKALAEVISINNGNVINRWADPEMLIPIQFRVKDLYYRAMGQAPTQYNFTVDGRVLNAVNVLNETYTTAPFYNSLSTMTANAEVPLSELVELMTVWADNGRLAPFNGTFGITPKVTAENLTETMLTPATRTFTAVEVLPASTSTMDLESVNGGATVILNSTNTYPVEVKAVVHALHPLWGELINPELVAFGINGQTVPRADYQITVTTGAVDAEGQQDAMISIKATREIFARYFTDEFMDIDEQALAAGVPVSGVVRVNAPVSSNYGLRATLTQDKVFLAGQAVEGPEDDVTVASLDAGLQSTTGTDGFRIVDLTTSEILAEGATFAELNTSANEIGKVEVNALSYENPIVIDASYPDLAIRMSGGEYGNDVYIGNLDFYNPATNTEDETVSVEIDWGDGSPKESYTGYDIYDAYHEYPAGTESIATFKFDKMVPMFNPQGDAVTELVSFGDTPILNLRFERCKYLVEVPEVLPSYVTSLERMFDTANLFNSPRVSLWNTVNVTKFERAFQNAVSFNQPLNNWNMSNAVTLQGMFYGAREFDQPLNNWDTSNVLNMRLMFGVSKYNSDITTWNTAKVTDMWGMFYQAYEFNQPIGGWNVGNVTNFHGTFQQASKFNQDISPWDVKNATDMAWMFYQATAFNRDLSLWCVAKILSWPTDFQTGAINWALPRPVWGTCPSRVPPELVTFTTISGTLYYKGTKGDSIVFSDGSVQNVTDANMLTLTAPAGTHTLKLTHSRTTSAVQLAGYSLREVHNFPTMEEINWFRFGNPDNSGSYGSEYLISVPDALPTNLTNTSYMFHAAESFNQDISGWNMSHVTDTRYMFRSAAAFNQPIGSWDMTNVEYVEGMFNNTTAFNQPLNNWSFPKVTSLASMFSTARAFNQPLNNWNTVNITNMSGTFGASAFNQDISGWNTSNVTTMRGMFSGNSNFNQPIGTWDVSKVTDMWGMFSSTYAFNGDISPWNTVSVTDMNYMFSSATSFGRDLSGWCVPLILGQPTNFAQYANNFPLAKHPVWGTCPNG